MAKNTQEAEVIVTLNGQAAKRAIEDMTKEYDRLTKAAIDAYKAGNDALGKELDAKAKKLMKDVEITRRETKKFADVMRNINAASLTELRSAAKKLQSEINKLTPGTKEFIEKSRQLKEVNSRINQLRNGFKGVVEEEKRAALSMKGLADGFNKYFGIVSAGIASVTGLSMAFRKCAEEAAKLDDVYADVMKTTGLTHDEVAALDKSLMKINTRTSREQLLLLARDAGKLGIQGKENILGFVRAADQIQVALGEDLGEGAIRNLGKIADVLGYTKSMGVEKALLSIGSAVNAVGQDSTASEAYLVEFTQRLAGVGAQAGISAADLIGFASGLDQSAMKVEMASTAFQKFMMKMFEDPAQFASYAKMEVKEFTDLLQNDANTAITTVLKSLKDKDGFAAMVPIFKDMGLDGARAVSVLASMASNLDAVTQAQALANEEFIKASSVSAEYSTKNNNLQAQLEKARKEFHNASIALGQSLNPIMLKSTKATTYLIKILPEYGKQIRNAAIAIAALTLAIKAQSIAESVGLGLKKAWNTIASTGTVVSNRLMAAYYKLTGQTLLYAQAQRTANAAMNSSVIGVIITLVGLLAAKLTSLNLKRKMAAEEARAQFEEESRLTGQYAEEEAKVRTLARIVEDNNLKLSDRKKALDELRKIVPYYHADLTQEGVLINNNRIALEEYNKQLRTKARLELKQESVKGREDEIMNLEEEGTHLDERIKEAQARVNSLQHLKERADVLLDMIGDDDQARMHVEDEAAPYVEAQNALNALLTRKKEVDDKLTELNTEQAADLEWIGVYSKELQDNLTTATTAMEKEINDVKLKYKNLFQEIRNSSMDNPVEGENEIRLLKIDMDKEIDDIKKTYAAAAKTESAENAILTQAQFDFLQERYDKLTKKEKAMVDAGYAALSEEDSKALSDRYAKLAKANTDQRNKLYQDQVKQIEQEQRKEQNDLNRLYFDREMTAEEHESKLSEIKVKYLMEKRSLAEKYGQDTTQIEQQLLTLEVEQRKRAYESELKLSERQRIEEESTLRQRLSSNEITQSEFDQKMLESRELYLREQQELALKYKQDGSGIQLKDIEARQKEEEKTLKRGLTSQEITQQQYDARMIEIRVKYLQQRLELARQNGQDETAILQSILDAQVEAENLAFEQMEKLKQDAKAVREGLDPKLALATGESDEMKKLQELHDAKLLSEEEYEKAVRGLHKRYAQANLEEDLKAAEQYTQKVSSIMSEASNFVNALKEAESAKLEAEYQAQLTAAGDNAERREQIEAEYEQKKLDLSKKYADVEMGINIAKTVAAGALAAIQAYAQLGPIAGAVAAALIAATTAAEVAVIVAQRNAIKNSSIGNTAGSSYSPSSGGDSEIGERVITGYSEGGYTETSAKDSRPVGVVHANEWVAPAPMVRRNPVVFRNLEEYRKQGGSIPTTAALFGKRERGFSEGGFTSGQPGSNTGVKEPNNRISRDEIRSAVYEAISEAMADKRIKAYVVRREIDELDRQDKRFKEQTSR